MRTLLASLVLAGCSFHPAGAPNGGPDAPGAGDDAPGGPTDAPDAPGCYGTSGRATVCLDGTPPATRTFGSDTLILTSAGSTQCAALQAGSSDVCVIAAGTITIEGGNTVTGTGDRPLVLVATTGALTIDGSLDVASHRLPLVLGAGYDSDACSPGTDPTNHGGGQGGGFATTGGDGGHSNGSADASTHGAATPPVTLRGGCPGADGGATPGSLGHGGGAVLLIAPSIAIGSNGKINASGAGGGAGVGGIKGGGGGGGSGGMIVLDAPVIASQGAVYAKGAGGGGGAGGGSGTPGEDPAPTGPAQGGPKGSSAGDGGDGADGADAADKGHPGGDGTNSTDGGGGGGGGHGVIEVYRHAGAIGGTVEPPISL